MGERDEIDARRAIDCVEKKNDEARERKRSPLFVSIFFSERKTEKNASPFFFFFPKLRYPIKQRAAMLCSKLSVPRAQHQGPEGRRARGRSGDGRSNLPSFTRSSKATAFSSSVVAASSTSGAPRLVFFALIR